MISEHSEHSELNEHSEHQQVDASDTSSYLDSNGLLNCQVVMKNENASRCEKLLQVWMPEVLANAISSAARKNFQSKSEYVRQVAIERLRADGIDPAQMAGAA